MNCFKIHEIIEPFRIIDCLTSAQPPVSGYPSVKEVRQNHGSQKWKYRKIGKVMQF